MLASRAGQSGGIIVEPDSLLPVAGVVVGVALKWVFDSLTERGRRERENQFRGWDTRREAYALLRQRASDAMSKFSRYADASAMDLDSLEVKEHENRYTQAVDAAYEQLRTIELLAPNRVTAAARNLVQALPDVWSHLEEPEPTPDYRQAADAFVAAARTDLGAAD